MAYIEEDLLKKNGLESFSPVGMSNIVFPQTSGISHIGSYKIPLDIKGTNLALSNLIDQIQNSGRITIKDGKLVRTSSTSSPSTNDLSDLDNLLITIDSASFALPLDRSVVENKVTITLVFYVRGRNLSDYIEYRNRLALKVREIKTGVESAAQECKNPDISLCKNGKVFSAVNAIKNLSDDIKNLDLKMTELSKSSTVNDLSTEFNTLIQLSANTSTIETAFNSYKTVINTIK